MTALEFLTLLTVALSALAVLVIADTITDHRRHQ